MKTKNQIKMKNSVFLLLILISLFFLFGCGKVQDVDNLNKHETISDTTPIDEDDLDSSPDTLEDSQQLENSDDELSPIDEGVEEIIIEEEPKECTSEVPAHHLKRFELSLDDLDEIEFDDEGYSFRIFPVNDAGEVIKLEGNLKINLMMTDEDINDKLKTGTLLYSKNLYLNPKNVLPDCGTQRIYIKYIDIEKQTNYRFLRDGDMGELVIELTRTGSNDFFEKVYKGVEYDYSFLTPE
jgi:hypothetical protein